jgi:cytochrome c1
LVVEAGPGALSPEEFDAAIYDLTNFLYYVSEPARLERQRTGVFVLLFLIILGSFTYLLNREYWKDIDVKH